MDENLLLLRQIADQLRAVGNTAAAERLLDQARAVEQQTQTIRQVALAHGPAAAAGPAHAQRRDER